MLKSRLATVFLGEKIIALIIIPVFFYSKKMTSGFIYLRINISVR